MGTFSMKGYIIGEALYRNKDGFKAFVAIILGVNFFAGFDYKIALLTVGAGAVAFLAKMIQDAIDYGFKDK